MIYTDFHFHLLPCFEAQGKRLLCKGSAVSGVTCCHSEEEFIGTEALLKEYSENEDLGSVKMAFGLHPQMPVLSNAVFLEKLLAEKRISAIGECGFDYFTQEFREGAKLQKEAFEVCLELASSYKTPLIIHNRKALNELYLYSAELRKVSAVIFHGFAFSSREAESLLKKGINAYFSFGKALLNGNKKSVSCVQDLPLDRLLFETDAPYMTLKGEDFTPFSHIQSVYEKAAELRRQAVELLVQDGVYKLDLIF